jgi:hypothetical protein
MDDEAALARAKQATRRHVVATEEIAEFVARLPVPPPDPALTAEYAALLGREESARNDRDEALYDLGLVVRSIEPTE